MDAYIQAVLESNGHRVTIGLPYHAFYGAGLEEQDVVLLLANYNWSQCAVGISPCVQSGPGDMPLAGQEALVDFVSKGGGLVTAEWTVWKWATSGAGYPLLQPFVESFAYLGDIFPVYRISTYGYSSTLTYAQASPNALLNNGLPPAFEFPVDDVEGTEMFLFPLPTATVFYGSRGSIFFPLCGRAGLLNQSICELEGQGALHGAGLVGWRIGAGHVLQFSTVMGPKEFADPRYGRLVANAVTWAGHENLGPLVNELRFNPGTVQVGESVTATFVGHQLTAGTYFDLRYHIPGGADEVVFNWQQETSAEHRIPADGLSGFWDVTGIRAHQDRDDHSGD